MRKYDNVSQGEDCENGITGRPGQFGHYPTFHFAVAHWPIANLILTVANRSAYRWWYRISARKAAHYLSGVSWMHG
jgi:hypothetical protein